MSSILSVLPPIVLAIGGALAHLSPSRIALRRRPLGVAASALATLASALVFAAVLVSPRRHLALSLLPTSGALLGAPGLEVDLLGATAVLAISLFAWLSLAADPDGDETSVPRLLWVAAAAAFLVSACRTPFGLVYGWLALDLALLLAPGGDRRSVIAGQVGLLAAVAGLAASTTVGLAQDASPLLPPPASAMLLLIGAGAIRMGLYPIWWALPIAPRSAVRSIPVHRLAPALSGLYLILFMTSRLQPGEGWLTPILGASAVAALGGGIMAWLQDDRGEATAWQIASQGGLVVLAAAFGGSLGAGIALVLAADLVLTRVALCATDSGPRGRLRRATRWLAAASALGLPPTLGFAGRWLLYRELLAANHLPALLLVMVGSLFSASYLIVAERSPTIERRVPRGVAFGALLAAATTLVLGVWNLPVDRALRALVGSSQISALADVMATIRYPLTMPRAGALLVAILLPSAMAPLVARVRLEPGTMDVERLWRRARDAVGLESLAGSLARLVIASGALAQRAAGFDSPRRAMAWTLLAVLVVTALLIATGYGGGPLPTPTPPTLLSTAILLAVAAVIAFVVSVPATGATLLGLTGGYVLLGVVLALSSGGAAATVLVIAAIDVLAGLLVVAVLGLGLVQPQSTGVAHLSARQLRILQVGTASSGQRWIVLIALAITVLLVHGTEVASMPTVIPLGVLRTAMLFAIGGGLVVIFAGTALQLVAGVLLVLIGFQAAYAHADPGLMAGFAIAAFQVLFAVVASFFLSLTTSADPEREA